MRALITPESQSGSPQRSAEGIEIARSILMLLMFLGIDRLGCLDSKADNIPEPSVILYGVVHNTSQGQDVRVTSGVLTWTFKPSDGGIAITNSTLLTNINDQFSFVLHVPCESPFGNSTPSSNALRIMNPPITYSRATVTLDGKSISLKDATQGNLTLSAGTRGLVERVDLNVQAVLDDYDTWAMRIFQRTGNQNEDPDDDRMSNLAEFKAGTDPKDKTSLFAFIEIKSLNNSAGAQIKWSSVAGKSYTILRSPILSLNPADYREIKTKLVAAGSETAYMDTDAPGDRLFFYRVKVDE